MIEGTEAAGAEAPVETTATEAKTETPVTETAKEETAAEVKETEAEETEDRPKRESGYARMKRRALLAEAALANQRLRETAGPKESRDDADKPPREEDFNGDWGKFIAASAAFEAKQAVKSVLQDDRKASQSDRVQQLQSEVLAEFEERTEEFKSKATDFDDVVSGFVNKGGKFSDTVRDLVMDSDVGPQLTYHLAKNPALANKLNGLTPLQAAKEIGRLEDALSKLSTKTTKAPPPARPLNGGAGPAIDPRTGPDDMAAFATWLNKSLESRRGR